MNGFINVLKPPGMTSSQVVGFVRRLLDGQKAGHAGTLDPQAAGILPVMVGKAARLFDYLVDKQKAYVAEIAFGTATDTQDAQGKIIAQGDQYPTYAQVHDVLPRFIGQVLQAPPSYSAIKQNGQRLYDLARKGELVKTQPRLIQIDDITLGEEMQDHGMMLHIHCGKGTYVRTICHDIGQALSCPAHMRFLLRTKSGVFTLDNAFTLEQLQAAKEEGKLLECLLPMDLPLMHLPSGIVPPNLAVICKNGGQMPLLAFPAFANIMEGALLRLYLDNAFMGIACRKGDIIAFRAMVG